MPWTREGSLIHLAVRAGSYDPSAGDARASCGSHHRGQRHATLAGVQFYVAQALSKMDLRGGKAVALDEPVSKWSHSYVTVFIDLNRKQKLSSSLPPARVRAVWPCSAASCVSIAAIPTIFVEVVRDMSPAFLTAISESFSGVSVTVDWFYVVQLFTIAVDEVRKAEAKERKLPTATRWAVLKTADGGRLTEKQQQALTELGAGGLATAWRLKEMLRWVREAISVRAVQWRNPHFTRDALNVYSA
ncbi:hypothetical protein DFAR_2810025 [Desulfarculales bacterium]